MDGDGGGGSSSWDGWFTAAASLRALEADGVLWFMIPFAAACVKAAAAATCSAHAANLEETRESLTAAAAAFFGGDEGEGPPNMESGRFGGVEATPNDEVAEMEF